MTDAEELAAFRAECDAVGVPYDAAGLVRHWKGNAGLKAAFDAEAKWFAERKGLLERIEELERINHSFIATPTGDVHDVIIERDKARSDLKALEIILKVEREERRSVDARLGAVLALHVRLPQALYCRHCQSHWPCPTARAAGVAR